MEKIYKLAKGTMRVSVEGAQPESVLNFCAENGIEFWDVSPKSDFCIYMNIFAHDAPSVMSKNGINGIEIRILSSRGGKNMSRAAKRRYALIASVSACIVLLSASSLFVWRFDVEGNNRISDAKIIRALNDCGVSYGSFWPGISTDKVKSRILMKNRDIAWLSVNLSNSCAHVVVHERIEKPEIMSEKGSADIIASKSGVVTKISVLSGQKSCAVGDTVIKGDTLISGTMTSETAREREVYAMGSVTARTWYEINAETPLSISRKCDKKRSRTRISLIVGKKRIKISGDSRNLSNSCDKITKVKMFGIKNVFVLPVGIIKESVKEYETQTRNIDEAAVIESMKKTLYDELMRSVDGGEIVKAEYSVSKDDKTLTVTLRSECIEEIGITNDREGNRS